MHLPVADAGVTALSYFDVAGAAVAVGERPLLSIQSPEAMVRMSMGEALTNIAGVPIGPGGGWSGVEWCSGGVGWRVVWCAVVGWGVVW